MKKKQEIIIREMEARDFDHVAALENENWTSVETPAIIDSSAERYLENLQQGLQYFLAVEEKTDEIFAVIVLFDKHRHLDVGKSVLTFAPMVVKEARGQGLGKFIIDFVLDFAKDQAYHKLSIDVLSTNIPAIKLYESLDFIQEGREVKEFFINGNWVDNLTYAYFIKDSE